MYEIDFFYCWVRAQGKLIFFRVGSSIEKSKMPYCFIESFHLKKTPTQKILADLIAIPSVNPMGMGYTDEIYSETNSTHLYIYPNPNSGIFTLKINSKKEFNLEVTI